MKNFFHIYMKFFISVFLLLVTSCEEDNKNRTFYDEGDVYITSWLETNQDNFSKFLSIMKAAGMKDALNAYNPFGDGFTAFIPANAAIDQFIQASEKYNTFDDLLKDVDFIRILARFHIVNSAYSSNDFPFGALKDTTATGDYLTIGFIVDDQNDESYYIVNNTARITEADIELVNGFIHVIDRVLEPIIYSSFDWIKMDGGFTILSEAFERTGLNDTLGIYRYNNQGKLVRNRYTLFAEADTVFQKRGIHNFNDLNTEYGYPNLPMNDFRNGLYQFTAYHILEGDYYLDDFATGIYNTFANFPLNITVGKDILLNVGFKIIDTLIVEGDTLKLNYIPVLYENSNIPSRNGAIHQISEILEVYKPPAGINTFQFYEETLINDIRQQDGSYIFDDPAKFEKIKWQGVKYLHYEKNAGNYTGANNLDYIWLEGQFTIDYEIPKVVPGAYSFIIRANTKLSGRATAQVYFDGKRIGATQTFTSTSTAQYVDFKIGSVDLIEYKPHIVRIETVIPGVFAWDYVRFVPLQ